MYGRPPRMLLSNHGIEHDVSVEWRLLEGVATLDGRAELILPSQAKGDSQQKKEAYYLVCNQV